MRKLLVLLAAAAAICDRRLQYRRGRRPDVAAAGHAVTDTAARRQALSFARPDRA